MSSLHFTKRLLLLAFTLLWANVASAAAYTSIHVFGDSMLDGGTDPTTVTSFYKMYGDPFKPTAGNPHVPFYNFTFSDGPVAAELMATQLGLFNTSQFFNYAVGGDQASELVKRIGTFYNNTGRSIDPTGLYIIEQGQVDLLRNLSTPEQASTNVVNGIQDLYNRGARRFMVLTSFYMGNLPSYKNECASCKEGANNISINFRKLLISKINALSFSDHVILFDNGKALETMRLNPSNYGFTNVVDACIISTDTGQYCSNRQEYMFWDNVHLTGLSQKYIGQLMADAITLPNVTLTAPSSNLTLMLNASTTLSATAKDGDGTIAKVEFYDGATLLNTDSTAPYSVSWIADTAGTHTITAKAFDNDNNFTISEPVTILVDNNAPPIVSLGQASGNAGLTQGSITATASDSDGSISKVELYVNNNLNASLTSAPYTFYWSGAANGTYSLTAKAYDNKNAVTTSNTVSVVVNANATNLAPKVSLAQPVGNTTLTQGSITATASDSDGSISKVEFYVNNAILATVTSAPYLLQWSGANKGTYNVFAKAYDNKNATTNSNTVAVTVK